MKSTRLPFLLTILVLDVYEIQGLSRPRHEKVVACYVSSWAAYRPDDGQFNLENLRPEHCSHLIYAFAGLNPTTSNIKSLDPWADLEDNSGKGNYRKMTALRHQFPGLKITLGIGGWNEGSANYSALAASFTRRKAFVTSVVEYLRKYDFDGLDLDWEFPSKRGGAPYDKQNFATLVEELRNVFRYKGLLLTAAISADIGTIDAAYDIPEISRHLDYIHVMAYDYHGAWDRKILPNAPLRSTDRLSVVDTIAHLLNKGAPSSKLVLGIPTYGRTFILTSLPKSLENPIGLPSIERGFQGRFTREDGFMGYNEICRELVDYPQSWRTGWDEYSNTAYAMKDNNVVMYDNYKSIRAKIKYVSEFHLAGVMIWTVDTDDFRGYCSNLHHDFLDPLIGRDYPLLRVINMALEENENALNENSVTSKSNVSSSSEIICADFILMLSNIFVTIHIFMK